MLQMLSGNARAPKIDVCRSAMCRSNLDASVTSNNGLHIIICLLDDGESRLLKYNTYRSYLCTHLCLSYSRSFHDLLTAHPLCASTIRDATPSTTEVGEPQPHGHVGTLQRRSAFSLVRTVGCIIAHTPFESLGCLYRKRRRKLKSAELCPPTQCGGISGIARWTTPGRRFCG